jgi:hypothetical protein
MEVCRAGVIQSSMFDAVRCRDAIAVPAHGGIGFSYIKNVGARHAAGLRSNTSPRYACHDVDDRKRAARRSGAVFLAAMPDDLRHGGRASAVGLRGVRPENGKPIILSF